MLFFKDIKNQKLASPSFKAIFDRECHICSLTLMVIERMEFSKEKEDILDRLKVPHKDYDLLKKGDLCHPEQVAQLCRYLDIKTEDLPPCPHLTPDLKQ